jgi:hypothetical protein
MYLFSFSIYCVCIFLCTQPAFVLKMIFLVLVDFFVGYLMVNDELHSLWGLLYYMVTVSNELGRVWKGDIME